MVRLDEIPDAPADWVLAAIPAAGGVLREIAVDPSAPFAAVIVGPGGCGKSAVLDAVVGQYEQSGVPVLRVGSGATPETLAPETLTPDSAVLVDDAQRLEGAVLDHLRELAGTKGARIVVAYRPWPRGASLSALVTSLTRRRAPVMVGHLDRPGVAAQIGARIGSTPPDALVELAYERAGGLPSLVDLLCQALADTGALDPRHPERFERPERLPLLGALAEQLRCQLDALDPAVLKLLQALAVGASLDTELLAVLLDTDPDTLTDTVEAARATGFVTDDGAIVPLVRRLLLRLTPELRTRDLQRRLAGAELDRGGSMLATGRHLLGTGASGQRVAAVLERAGDEALRQSPSLATKLYDAAVDAGASVAGVAARRAEAAALLGDLDQALRLADQVVADPAAPDRERGISVAAAVMAHRGLLARSAELYRSLPRAGTTTSLAVPALLGTGALSEARAALAEADAGDRGSSLLAGAGDLMARGMLDTVTGSPTAALSQLARASALLEPTGASVLLPDTPAALTALVALHCGELSVAESTLNRAVDARLGGPPALIRHRLLQAWIAMARGRLDAARELLARADQPGGSVEPRDELISAALHVSLARRDGDLPTLTSAWTRARDAIVRHPVDLYALQPLGELAVAAARLGDQQWVTPHLKEGERLLDQLGNPVLWEAPMHWFGLHAAIIAEQPPEAERHAAALTKAASSSSYAAALSAAAGSWLRVLAGDIDAEAVQTAARRLYDAGLAWEGARLAGQAALRTTDRRAMSALLSCARGLKGSSSSPAAEASDQPTGGGSGERQAATRPAAGNGRPRSAAPAVATGTGAAGGSGRGSAGTPPGGSASISDREREVGELILAGLTYKQIGERLFISAKTVEHHVAGMRQRLGANSRDELFAQLRALIG